MEIRRLRPDSHDTRRIKEFISRGISCLPVQIFLEDGDLRGSDDSRFSRSDYGNLLGLGGLLRRVRLDLLGLFAGSLHAVFEGANSFAKPLSELRQFLGAENEKRDRKNDEQMCRLE
jgi:hypothetical protein